jgi:hypothetical protein
MHSLFSIKPGDRAESYYLKQALNATEFGSQQSTHMQREGPRAATSVGWAQKVSSHPQQRHQNQQRRQLQLHFRQYLVQVWLAIEVQ